MSHGTSEIQDVLCQYLLQQPSLDALLWHRLRAVNKGFFRVTNQVPPTRLRMRILPSTLKTLLTLADAPLHERRAVVLDLDLAHLPLQSARQVAGLLVTKLYLGSLAATGDCLLWCCCLQSQVS